MALQQDYTYKGILIQDAYFQVQLVGQTEKNKREAYLLLKGPEGDIIDKVLFTFEVDYNVTKNDLAQAYDAIKNGTTTPFVDASNAVDV